MARPLPLNASCGWKKIPRAGEISQPRSQPKRSLVKLLGKNHGIIKVGKELQDQVQPMTKCHHAC